MPAPKTYDRYQYETSPKKVAPNSKPKKSPQKPKKSTVKAKPTKEELKKAKRLEAKKRAKLVMYICFGFAILFAIGYRNSQINESFAQKQKLEREISEMKKANGQLEVSIQNGLNLNQLEQVAKEKFGMQKLTNKQTIYIDLPKKDYVEAGTEKVIIIEEEENFFQKIIDNILNIFK